MEKHKTLFIYVLAMIVIYYVLVRLPVLPDTIGAVPSKKIIKGIIGLLFGIGALFIYLKKSRS